MSSKSEMEQMVALLNQVGVCEDCICRITGDKPKKMKNKKKSEEKAQKEEEKESAEAENEENPTTGEEEDDDGMPPPPPGFDDDMPPPPGFDDDMPPPPGFDDDMPPPPGFDDEEDAKWKPPSLPDLGKPKKKMKVLHWDMVKDEALENSIWIGDNLAENINKIKIKKKEIEKLFQSISIKKGPKRTPSQLFTKTICLLSSKRQQNLSIFCARLVYTNEELVRRIFAMDEETVDQQLLSGLIRNAPTPEEYQAQQEFSGDIEKLDLADQYVRSIMKIPRFLPRMEAWLFKLKFFEIISKLAPSIQMVIDGCTQLINSKNWKKLLQIILAIGNYINGGNKKKISYGFRIRTLDKLTSMKSADKKYSLLSYIIKFVDENYVDVNQFIPELSKLTAANRVDIKGIPDEIGKLEKERNKLEKEIDFCKQENIAGDKFVQIMTSFLTECDEVIDDLKQKFEEMNSVLEQIALLYGENPKTFLDDPSVFLQKVISFREKWSREIDKIAKKKKKEQRGLRFRLGKLRLIKSSKKKKPPATPPKISNAQRREIKRKNSFHLRK